MVDGTLRISRNCRIELAAVNRVGEKGLLLQVCASAYHGDHDSLLVTKLAQGTRYNVSVEVRRDA